MPDCLTLLYLGQPGNIGKFDLFGSHKFATSSTMVSIFDPCIFGHLEGLRYNPTFHAPVRSHLLQLQNGLSFSLKGLDLFELRRYLSVLGSPMPRRYGIHMANPRKLPYPPEKMTHDMRFVGKWRLVDIQCRHVQISEALLRKVWPQFQWNIYEHYII